MGSVTLALLLLVRDEVDVIAANLDYHRGTDIDVIIVTDNNSSDGTEKILAERAARGEIVLCHEPSDAYAQDVWTTRMAAIARDDYGADWVLCGDADEFWYSPSGSLKASLAGCRASIVNCERRNMVAAADAPADGPWWRRLTFRANPPQSMPLLADVLNEPLPAAYFMLALPAKAAFRTAGLETIARGAHSAEFADASKAAVAACDIAIYHYPVRGFDQFCRSVARIGTAVRNDPNLGERVSWKYRRWLTMIEAGRAPAAFRQALPDAAALSRGLADGTVLEDRIMRARLAALTDCNDPSTGRAARAAQRLPASTATAGKAASAAEPLADVLLAPTVAAGASREFAHVLASLGAFPVADDAAADASMAAVNCALADSPGETDQLKDAAADDTAADRGDGRTANALFDALVANAPWLDLALIAGPALAHALPAWRAMAAARSLRLITILEVRQPLSAALELRAMNDTPLAAGLFLWAQTLLRCEAESRGHPRAIVTAPDWYGDWRTVARAMGRAMNGRRWPRWTPTQEVQIDAWLDRRAPAGDAGATDLRRVKNAPPLAIECHALLQQLHHSPEDGSVLVALDRLRAASAPWQASSQAALESLGQRQAALIKTIREKSALPSCDQNSDKPGFDAL